MKMIQPAEIEMLALLFVTCAIGVAAAAISVPGPHNGDECTAARGLDL
jgi:hypothetical protein